MEKATYLPVRGGTLPLPVFFPSVSSIKSNLPPIDYLKFLVAVEQTQFLISAYDFFPMSADTSALLDKARGAGAIVLMDSGNYERYWMHDDSWLAERFGETLSGGAFDLAFHFDNQDPPNTIKDITADVLQGLMRDQQRANEKTVLPIIHAPANKLARVAQEVAGGSAPLMVAVPERELGDGLLERARTVASIRAALDSTGTYIPLHLLGTGNPLSLLVFTYAGAESFDGLEWCQTAVDHDTCRLYHFQQRDLFADQVNFDGLEKLSYLEKTLFHNILFYRQWMLTLQEASANGTLDDLLFIYLPKVFAKQLQKEVRAIWAS